MFLKTAKERWINLDLVLKISAEENTRILFFWGENDWDQAPKTPELLARIERLCDSSGKSDA